MSLQIYDLTHTFGQFMPEWPSSPGVDVDVKKFHAKDGVFQTEWSGIMHRCTHMDAPIHVTECTPDHRRLPFVAAVRHRRVRVHPQRQMGRHHARGPRERTPKIEEGDIVMINMGMHHKWADTDEYFAYGPGIYKEGAQWLVDKKVKMVGYGCQANDHPLATKLVDHGLGPSHPHLIEEYKEADRPRSQGGLPRVGAGAQDPHGQRRHPRHRERRRRAGRGHRQTLHLHGLPVALAGWRWLHRPRACCHRPGPDVPV